MLIKFYCLFQQKNAYEKEKEKPRNVEKETIYLLKKSKT